MANKSDRPSMSRKKRRSNDENEVRGTEIVDVQRNAIETWLIDLKHWASQNQKKVRLYLLSGMGALLLFVILLYIYGLVADRHNIDFYTQYDKYNELKLKDVEKRKKDFEKLAADSADLCDSLISSAASYNGCLVSALSWLELGSHEKFAQYLERYGKFHDDDGLGAYILFYAAYAHEQAYELDKAYQLFQKLENIYSVVEKPDIAQYHMARIDYLRSNFDKAEKTLKKLLEDHKASQYRADAQKYLLLIAAMRSQQGEQLKSLPGNTKK